MTPILGKDGIISFKGESGWIAYACAETFSLKTTTETKSVKTIGDGYWEKVAAQKLSYSLSLNGLVVLDGSYGLFDLNQKQRSMEIVDWQMLFQDTNGGIKRIEGKALITDSDISSPSIDFMEGSIDMAGSGAYEVYDDNGICAATISDAIVTGSPGSRHLVFTASADTEYISYVLVKTGGGGFTRSGNVYRVDGFDAFIGIVIGGTYTVTATPYCISDIAGAEFTKTV